MSDAADYPTGRSRPAQAPLASAAPATVIPIPPSTGEPAGMSTAAPPRADVSPAAAVTFADPSTVAMPREAVPSETEASSAEEQALLAVLRLIDRNLVAGSLTPVERAFVEGARVMFDHLAKACKEILDRQLPSSGSKKGGSAEAPTSSRPGSGGKGSKSSASA